MDDDDFSTEGTAIAFEYGEISARVVTSAALSPDFIDTILSDLRKQVIAGARQLGMTYTPAEASADDA